MRQWSVLLLVPEVEERQRIAELMAEFRDRPMDLADASLVAATEALNDPVIFTQDSDFYIYRFRWQYSFQVVP